MGMDEGMERTDQIENIDLELMSGSQQGYCRKVPIWSKQITATGVSASLLIGVIYSVIVMKLNLTNGLITTLNFSAALLAFVFLRTWTNILKKAGILTTPFTRQEDTVVQTRAVACYSISVGGGFGSYLLGLNKRTCAQTGVDTERNTPGSYKEPGVGWMNSFLFVTSFVELLALAPLGKMIGFSFYPSTPSSILDNKS